ncbi:MAG: anti-sigma factor [Nocardioidaceae bacterium]|nr:anti-sigma factor [Nocardioidaceae bacterium]
MTQHDDRALGRPEVELSVPADGVHLSLLRTAAAAMAARLDFTLDDVEDLRMAVDEAGALLLQQSGDDAMLTFSFFLDGPRLVLRCEVPTPAPRPPRPEGFAWMVLTALASSVEVGLTTAAGASGLSLVLTHPREQDERS